MNASSVPAPVIEVRGLCKAYGHKLVIDDLSFSVRPGVVTGFLAIHLMRRRDA
jgi:ABC-2 type transport system ATP-binding protein